jgi:hypothetical protein
MSKILNEIQELENSVTPDTSYTECEQIKAKVKQLTRNFVKEKNAAPAKWCNRMTELEKVYNLHTRKQAWCRELINNN